MVNVVLLAKVMAMTTSSSDGEKLAALARANAMLAQAGKTWGDVLAARITALTPSADSNVEPAATQASMEEQIAFALGYLKPFKVSDSLRQFLDAIERTFNKTAYLNQFERARLFNAVRDCQAGRQI